MNPNRRRALSALGAGLASLAGCLDANDGEPEASVPPTTDPTETATEDSTSLPMGSPYEADGRSITVQNARVQGSIEEFVGAWTRAASVPDTQFVVVDVRTRKRSGDAELPRANEFAVAVDGEPTTAARTYVVANGRQTESPETYAFPVGTDPAPASIEVVWKPEQIRWAVGSDVVAEIPNAPRFEIRSFSAPAETERGTAVTLSVTVANVGEADGTFRAELGPTSHSHVGVISVDVPQGGTTTYEDSFRGYLEGEDDVSYFLDWGENALVRTVDVAEPATETGTPGRT